MKRKGHRNRQFSATRLSYSRDKSLSHSALSPHHTTSGKSQGKSLLCNNCFNLNAIKGKKDEEKKQNQEEKQGNCSFMDNGDSRKSRQVFLDHEMRKVNAYNLNKILENKIKKQSQKKSKYNQNNSNEKSYEEELIKMRKKNEEKRMKFKQDLDKQITFAKERRMRVKQQTTSQDQFIFFQPEMPSRKNHDIENKYKEELIQQIKQRKIQKQRQHLRQLNQNDQNNIFSGMKQDKKKVGFKNMYEQNVQDVKQELQKRKQYINSQKNEMKKEREEIDRIRQAEEQKILHQKQSKEQKRKQKISKYINDLKTQIKENQLQRQQQFNRLKKQILPSSFIPTHKIEDNPKAEPCTSCSQPFPRQFLTPCSIQKQ